MTGGFCAPAGSLGPAVWQDASIKRRGIDQILAESRARLRRFTAREAAAAMREGATLIDTRDGDLRSRDGRIPGSVHIPLSVLEWRVDPTSGHQSAALAGREDRLILICQEGYSSSLAAVRLHDLGFGNTTDVIGGFVAWTEAGLPVDHPGTGKDPR
jgi:rhodanese-related sulfurtransferase